MRRTLITLIPLFAACSGGDSEPSDWLTQWDPDHTETIQGTPVGFDDDPPMVYVEDCDLARELTKPGARFGPHDGKPGHGFICP